MQTPFLETGMGFPQYNSGNARELTLTETNEVAGGGPPVGGALRIIGSGLAGLV